MELQHCVEWEDFRLVRKGARMALTTPSAVVELDVEDWRDVQHALASALPVTSKPAKPGAARHGKAWTAEEDAELIRRFESGESAVDIGRLLERSRGGIIARLVHHGLIERVRP